MKSQRKWISRPASFFVRFFFKCIYIYIYTVFADISYKRYHWLDWIQISLKSIWENNMTIIYKMFKDFVNSQKNNNLILLWALF